MATIKRTKSEKESIGEIILFFAMLGLFHLRDGRVIEGPELAQWLASDHRNVARWWNLAAPDEQLYLVQEIQPAGGWACRVSARWRDMRIEVQESWGRQVSRKCAEYLERLRKVDRDDMARGVNQARGMVHQAMESGIAAPGGVA